MSLRLFIILVLALVNYCSLTFAHATDLREDYRLTWDLVEDDTKLRIKLEVRTLGYIGFGFVRPGEQPGMDKADIVISGVKNGSAYLLDSHGVGHSIPVLDAHQDYVYGDISENDTHTKVSFYRKLNTCDPDDVEITSELMDIIWSIGQDDNLGQHSFENRGILPLNLLLGFSGPRQSCDGEITVTTTPTESEDTPLSPRTKTETLDSDSSPDTTPTSTSAPSPTPDSSSVTLQSNGIVILAIAAVVAMKLC